MYIFARPYALQESSKFPCLDLHNVRFGKGVFCVYVCISVEKMSGTRRGPAVAHPNACRTDYVCHIVLDSVALTAASAS